MLGLAAREAAECQRCGGDLVETTDPANKYVPLPPVVCQRCVTLHHSEEQARNHGERAGMIHRAERHDRPTKKRG